MAGNRRSKDKKERWLMIGLYPVVLIAMFFVVSLSVFAGEETEEPKPLDPLEGFDERLADEWLDKLGITDTGDSNGFNLDDYDFDKKKKGDTDNDWEDLLKDYIDGDKNDPDEDDVTGTDDTADADDIDDNDSQDGDTKEDVTENLFEDYYFYNAISANDQKLYREIYNIMSNRKGLTDLSSSDLDRIDRIYNLVMGDHPELFYVDGYLYTQQTGKVAFSGSYEIDEGEALSYSTIIEGEVAGVLDGMPAGMSEYEKVKYFFKYIVDNTDYDLSSSNNQNMASVFVNHVSVCAGYARAMQYLCQKSGMQAMYVTGDAGGPHAWNVVRVDGQYYYLDVTWADPTSPYTPRPDYAYLCIPESRIAVDHTVEKDIYPVPECTSMDANFYVQENLYISELDDDVLQAAFEKSMHEYDGVVHIMASDARIYRALDSYLLGQGRANQFYYKGRNGGRLTYNFKDGLYSMMIYEK